MSSKSKHKNRGKRSPKPGQKSAQSAGAEPASVGHEDGGGHGIPDEIVHVPENTSTLRFLLMIGLIIVLLVIFLVPQAIMGTVRRSDDGDAFVRWTGPDGQPVAYGYNSFRNEKRLLAGALSVDPFLAGVVGVDSRNPTDEQLARFLILDELAIQSGLHVPDTDLVTYLRQLAQAYGGVTQYKTMARRSGGEQTVEASIRRILRAARYLQVTAFVGAIADPEEIQELWDGDHEELAFDLGFLPYEGLGDDARSELPGDEALESWLGELPSARREPLEVPERRAAEIVSFRDPETTPGTGLLQAFPDEPAEGEEPVPAEERARQYYDQVYFWHFLAPADEKDDGEPAPPTYVPFEEAKEDALAEAPVYFAMQKWLSEIRTAGKDVDLAALAEQYGLAYEPVPPSTREEYRERETRGNVGDTFATRVFQTDAGELAYSVVARGDALSLVRVTEIVPASLPPFEEIKGRVADLWVEDRVRELAAEKLDEIRATFSAEPLAGESEHEEVEGEEHDHRYADADTFRSTLGGLGIDVLRRDWADKALPPASDPALDDATNEFFRSQRQVQTLADDEVSPPLFDPAGGRAYLVRLAGGRPVPIENMSPASFDDYKARAAIDRRRLLLSEPTQEYLQKEFGLEFTKPAASDDTGWDDTGGEEAQTG